MPPPPRATAVVLRGLLLAGSSSPYYHSGCSRLLVEVQLAVGVRAAAAVALVVQGTSSLAACMIRVR